MDYTHIVVRRSTHDANGVAEVEDVLYRASDGMRIGNSIKQFVVWGEIPSRAPSHVFIDEVAAKRFLREWVPILDRHEQHAARMQCAAQQCPTCASFRVVIEERDGDSRILMPSGSLEVNDKGFTKLN